MAVEPSSTGELGGVVVVVVLVVVVVCVATVLVEVADVEVVIITGGVVTTPFVVLLVGEKEVAQQEHALAYQTVPEHAEAYDGTDRVAVASRKLLQSWPAAETLAAPLAVPVTARRQLSALQAAPSTALAAFTMARHRLAKRDLLILKAEK